MMTNPIGGLSAINAAYGWMSAANSLRNLSFCGGASNSNTLDNEKSLRLSMLNDSFNYKAYSLMDEQQKKLRDENIKRSFSTFA